MNSVSLRQLARQFTDGEIDQSEYRTARKKLINGIIDGTITVQENTYPRPLIPGTAGDTTRQRDHAKTIISSGGSGRQTGEDISATASAQKRPVMPIVLGIIAIILVVAIGFIVLIDSPDQVANKNTSDAEALSGNAKLPGTASGDKIIDDFLSQKLWHNDALASFQTQWSALTPAESKSALESDAMKRLCNAIHRQLLEEKSLAAIDDAQVAAQKQKQLIDFASSIGIVDPRFADALIETDTTLD